MSIAVSSSSANFNKQSKKSSIINPTLQTSSTTSTPSSANSSSNSTASSLPRSSSTSSNLPNSSSFSSNMPPPAAKSGAFPPAASRSGAFPSAAQLKGGVVSAGPASAAAFNAAKEAIREKEKQANNDRNPETPTSSEKGKKKKATGKRKSKSGVAGGFSRKEMKALDKTMEDLIRRMKEDHLRAAGMASGGSVSSGSGSQPGTPSGEKKNRSSFFSFFSSSKDKKESSGRSTAYSVGAPPKMEKIDPALRRQADLIQKELMAKRNASGTISGPSTTTTAGAVQLSQKSSRSVHGPLFGRPLDQVMLVTSSVQQFIPGGTESMQMFFYVPDLDQFVDEEVSEGDFRFSSPLSSTVSSLSSLFLPLPLVFLFRSLALSADTEGIFRIPGNSESVTELKNKVDEWNAIEKKEKSNDTKEKEKALEKEEDDAQDLIAGIETHALAALLKLYFRSLPQPLIPFALYSSILALFEKGDFPAVMTLLQSSLPVAHLLLFNILFSFLAFIASYSAKNHMSAPNLSICFAPNLLKPEKETIESISKDTRKVIGVITLVIEEFKGKREKWKTEKKKKETPAAAAAAATNEVAVSTKENDVKDKAIKEKPTSSASTAKDEEGEEEDGEEDEEGVDSPEDAEEEDEEEKDSVAQSPASPRISFYDTFMKSNNSVVGPSSPSPADSPDVSPRADEVPNNRIASGSSASTASLTSTVSAPAGGGSSPPMRPAAASAPAVSSRPGSAGSSPNLSSAAAPRSSDPPPVAASSSSAATSALPPPAQLSSGQYPAVARGHANSNAQGNAKTTTSNGSGSYKATGTSGSGEHAAGTAASSMAVPAPVQKLSAGSLPRPRPLSSGGAGGSSSEGNK